MYMICQTEQILYIVVSLFHTSFYVVWKMIVFFGLVWFDA